MAGLTVRRTGAELTDAHGTNAAAEGRSAEAGHRERHGVPLVADNADFAVRSAVLRRRLRSSIDNRETIRADRDRDSERLVHGTHPGLRGTGERSESEP